MLRVKYTNLAFPQTSCVAVSGDYRKLFYGMVEVINRNKCRWSRAREWVHQNLIIAFHHKITNCRKMWKWDFPSQTQKQHSQKFILFFTVLIQHLFSPRSCFRPQVRERDLPMVMHTLSSEFTLLRVVNGETVAAHNLGVTNGFVKPKLGRCK